MTDEPEEEVDGEESEPLAENVADEKAIRRRERKIERHQREAAEFWTRVLADPIGRREVWGLIEATHAFEDRFACGPNGFPQSEATWFHAGEKSVGQRLFFTLQRYAREGVMLMQDEYDPRFAKPKKRDSNG